jgi:hypothetical protein
MALGLTQFLAEMSTRNLIGGKGRPVRNAENLTAICEPIVWKMWEPRVSQPCGPLRPVTGIPLPFLPLEQTSLLCTNPICRVREKPQI